MEKKVDLFFFFRRRFVCKSAGTQLFYENTASALIATSLLLLQATERRPGKRPTAGGSVQNWLLRRLPARPSLGRGKGAPRARCLRSDQPGRRGPGQKTKRHGEGGTRPGLGGTEGFSTEPGHPQCVQTILSVFVNL